MELLKIHEPVNGKVVTDWEFTEEEIHFFVEYAVLDILEKQLKKMKPELKTCFDCGEIADGLYSGPVPSAAHGHAAFLFQCPQ